MEMAQLLAALYNLYYSKCAHYLCPGETVCAVYELGYFQGRVGEEASGYEVLDSLVRVRVRVMVMVRVREPARHQS